MLVFRCSMFDVRWSTVDVMPIVFRSLSADATRSVVIEWNSSTYVWEGPAACTEHMYRHSRSGRERHLILPLARCRPTRQLHGAQDDERLLAESVRVRAVRALHDVEHGVGTEGSQLARNRQSRAQMSWSMRGQQGGGSSMDRRSAQQVCMLVRASVPALPRSSQARPSMPTRPARRSCERVCSPRPTRCRRPPRRGSGGCSPCRGRASI